MVPSIFAGCASTLDLTTPYTPDSHKKYDKFVKRYAPDEAAFIAVTDMAAPYIHGHMWDEAIEIFATYRPLFKPLDRRFANIISMLEADVEGLVITNLGGGINTDYGEYGPVPTVDGRTLYFCGKNRPDSRGGEDVYVSEMENGKWQKAKNLGEDINTRSHEALLSVSADGNRIIFFGNYDGSLGDGDIFYADKTKEGWSAIKHFPTPINSEYFDADAVMTSDGKAILFTSDRPGCVGRTRRKDEPFQGHKYGNLDIFVCVQDENGWSEPINLGPTINTPYCERTPFLHPDGRTLYFASDGHYGLGQGDVFKAVRLSEDSWTQWSEPVNLGKEINTAGQDWAYKIATSGDIAYFTTSVEGERNAHYDICSITLPQKARPDVVATVHGTVTDQDNNPLEAGIKWEDLSTGDNVGRLRSDPRDGGYFIVLPLGKNYGYYADKEGYYPVSENIDLRDETEPLDIVEDIVLVSIEDMKTKSISVRINNIFFEFDKYDLLPESFPELNRLAKILKDNPEAKVKISGHTDAVGTDAYNLDLSKKRARSVIEYLIEAKCNAKNLIAEGHGENMPVANNKTDAGRALNRRVEFSFIKE